MAQAGSDFTITGRVDDDSETCPICLDPFRSPRTLKCGHRFCGRCLETYVTVEKRNNAAVGICCPTCRRNVEPKMKATKSWSSLFTDADLVESLYAGGSWKQSDNKACGHCQRKGSRQVGVVYCLDCDAYFCKSCREVHLTFSEMSGLQHSFIAVEELDDDVHKLSLLKGLGYCHVHAGKRFEYFCEDDRSLCCAKCVIVSHRNCGEIRTVEECAGHFEDEGKTASVRDRLTTLEEGTRSLHNRDSKMVSYLRRGEEQLQAKLLSFEEQVMRRVRKTTRRVTDEAKYSYHTQEEVALRHGRQCLQLETALKDSRSLLSTAAEKGSSLHLVCAIENIEAQLGKYETQLAGMSRSSQMVDVEICFADAVKRIDEALANIKVSTRRCDRTDDQSDWQTQSLPIDFQLTRPEETTIIGLIYEEEAEEVLEEENEEEMACVGRGTGALAVERVSEDGESGVSEVEDARLHVVIPQRKPEKRDRKFKKKTSHQKKSSRI